MVLVGYHYVVFGVVCYYHLIIVVVGYVNLRGIAV